MNFAPLSAYLPLHVPADKLKICFYFFFLYLKSAGSKIGALASY